MDTPKRIREYEILDVIGKGGMGAVYKARHIYLDEVRAIKVIHSSYAEREDARARFIREAKILAKLRHPNLILLHEFGILDDGTLFMAMEYLDGESVLRRLQRLTRIPLEAAANMVKEAALGLHSAHRNGIIHRDISPDNLVLIKSGMTDLEITKVIDFGIGKVLMEDESLTATGAIIGKVQYLSPEQCGLLENQGKLDHRSDIYSLAITFYHMVSGKLPFYSPTPQGYIYKQVMEEPKPLSTYFSEGNFPEELERVIKKGLAKDREKRYQTMEEFAVDLDHAVFQRRQIEVRPEEKAEIRVSKERKSKKEQPLSGMFFSSSTAPSIRPNWRRYLKAASVVATVSVIGIVWLTMHSAAMYTAQSPPHTLAPSLAPAPPAPTKLPRAPAPQPTPLAPPEASPPAPIQASPPEPAQALPSTKRREPPQQSDQTGHLADISIQTVPPARLFIDGQAIGRTPVATKLIAGEHKIFITRRGYKPERRFIIVKNGEPLHLKILLQRSD